MATSNQTLTLSATITDAEFRAVSQFIANTMETGGIIKTSDTGQVNLTTMTFPVANYTAAGYEIRRFSDALQATAPIFMKIEYARGGGANFFDIFLTLGTGSDGAGNITGIKYSRTQLNLATNFTSSSCLISAGASWVIFMLGTNSSGLGVFSLERAKTSTGADSNRGLYLLTNKPPQQCRFIDYTGVSSPINEGSSGGCFAPAQATSGLHSSGNVAVYPFYFFGAGETMPPSRNLVGGFDANFTDGSSYSVQLYGQTQTMYKPLSGGSYWFNPARTYSPSSLRTLMRWE